MFRRTKNRHTPPAGPFSHGDGCQILAADPGVEIPWSEVETGYWVRICQCSEEHYRAPEDPRRKLDPLDPGTMRHLPQCEFKDVIDPAILRVLLRIKPGLSPGISGSSVALVRPAGQVPDFAEAE